jgi:PAS domain S-box-containing protein
MTPTVATLAAVIAVLGAAVVVLLLRERRHAHAQEAARRSEERFRLMADRAPVMMWTARPDTSLDFINQTCVETIGLPFERLLEHGWMEICHPDDLAPCIAIYMPAVEARLPFTMEYRLLCADGGYHWFHASAVPRFTAEGGFNGYIGCSLDITGRKEAEDSMRSSQAALEESHREIQHLAGRLIEGQDAERARIARDLHDDVSQQLAGMSIALSGLRHRMDDLHLDDGLKADLRGLHERTSALAQNVRHLSHDLHPTVLRHAGLVAALSAHAAAIERAHGTEVTYDAAGDFGSIAPEAALTLYRIAQEALRNVIAHSRAGRADVRLLRVGEEAELTISDDGGGFDVAALLRQAKGLGLVSIGERARLAGGSVSITSAPGEGTCIRARIPAEAGVAGEAARNAPVREPSYL